ncbi:hypothetical protein [Mesobacillus harenae]|uniref:hypothetical protein n=1 Tax=Mesobacillus harenae TaxID=2213203 RepID=UPI001580B52B|nr:hypothetical protein [Mesobacillus harenae]
MKSFFDFISWTEATQGVRRWSWMRAKAQAPVKRRMDWRTPTEIKETRRAIAIRC